MKLSIIIPCFNQVDLLKDCLSSISRQSFNSYEIIVIDGNSTDGTKAFLKKVSDSIKHVSEPDNGIYDAMNKGINMANGEWLYFMGVDDRFYDSELLDSFWVLITNKNVKIIAGKILYEFKEQDSFFIKRRKGLVKSSWSQKIWIKNTLHHQGTFYNKSIFNKMSFNTDYKILADYDLNLKLWQQKRSILIIDKIIARCGTQGLSKEYNWSLYEEEIKIKTKASSFIFLPFFTILAIVKYGLKQIF